MLKIISRLILMSMGWTYNVDAVKGVDKCVLIVAPHTSAWDFIIGKAIFVLAKVPAKIGIKKEAFFFPLNWVLRYLGGVPIDRTQLKEKKEKISLVDALANAILKTKKICLVITPEGSRGKRKQWKTGFYYVALKAKVPIALGHLDFSVKEGVIDKLFYPTGDLDKDMREIMAYYQDKLQDGKYANRSVLDERWS
jgi:1-acyl-sn-glycerol-3-phosphate acyltransferase